MNYKPFIASFVVVLILIIVSNLFSLRTSNTIWGTMCFIVFCIINLIGCIVNIPQAKKTLKIILIFLSVSFIIWIVVSVVVIVVFILPIY